ncbi:MAG: hypothetical protein K6C40_07070 [Thermoguttaceae bacterium]|nr:hypothetical protein [Thermoguttaceae bacterium]
MSNYSSNRRAGTDGNPVSLFPFLAVLLCTMGALIAILLIIARQAQISTDQMFSGDGNSAVAELEPDPQSTSEIQLSPEDRSSPDNQSTPETQSNPEAEKELEQADAGPSREELENAIQKLKNRNELEQWRNEELQNVRSQLEKEAQKARIALSTTQEKRNQLMQQLQNFREALIRLEKEHESLSAEDLKKELAEGKKRLEDLKKELEKAENTARNQNGSYAILPHKGPNGTRRYPMYIECRSDGAWLMPENVKLGAADFEGVLSMENPLEMALMAKRQYLLRNGIFQETPDGAQEPYPLIIVRPGGILYLYMVKEALQSWKSEFGYELVEDSLSVAFPPNDDALKGEMLKAIAEARVRQREIAAMAPTLPQTSAGAGGSVVYHPNNQGGQAVQLDQNSRLARTLRRSAEQAAQGATLRNGSGHGNQTANGNWAGNGNGNGNGFEGSAPNGFQGRPGTGGLAGVPSPAPTSGAYGANGGSMNSQSGEGENAQGAPNTTKAAANDLSLWAAATAGEENSSENTSSAGQNENGSRSPKGKTAQEYAAGTGGPNGSPAAGGTGDSMGAGAPGMGMSGENCPSNAPEAGQMPPQGAGQDVQRVSESEGQNWALANYRPNMTSLTRPVPMECRKDRIILSATPGTDAVTIMIGEPIPTLKRLAKEIGTQINQWGDAGRGVYWKPILRVRVAEDARLQYERLLLMLDGSGLIVEEVK